MPALAPIVPAIHSTGTSTSIFPDIASKASPKWHSHINNNPILWPEKPHHIHHHRPSSAHHDSSYGSRNANRTPQLLSTQLTHLFSKHEAWLNDTSGSTGAAISALRAVKDTALLAVYELGGTNPPQTAGNHHLPAKGCHGSLVGAAGCILGDVLAAEEVVYAGDGDMRGMMERLEGHQRVLVGLLHSPPTKGKWEGVTSSVSVATSAAGTATSGSASASASSSGSTLASTSASASASASASTSTSHTAALSPNAPFNSAAANSAGPPDASTNIAASTALSASADPSSTSSLATGHTKSSPTSSQAPPSAPPSPPTDLAGSVSTSVSTSSSATGSKKSNTQATASGGVGSRASSSSGLVTASTGASTSGKKGAAVPTTLETRSKGLVGGTTSGLPVLATARV